ncbi:hypothetical protein QFZ60_001584 [Arthrobacter sp. B2I5]|uniref:terminase small subunit n=1 Tax=Arthrobacter sp. B2I5 TaxID=3042266 RepID=UPI002788D413|nr:terminase small subunit [Arthrobacter sp. B2I5]MDQ0825411.1 hypothetical protein [Arthrobacter sp. B2I5]
MARPTKYKKLFCKSIIEYFDQPLTYQEEETKYYKGEPYPVTRTVVTELPTFERFASSIGVTMSTMWEWKQSHEEFSNAYSQAQQLQEQMIVGNAMAGRYVGSFAQFYLKNKHQYVEQSQIDHTTDGKPMTALVEIVRSGDQPSTD